MNAACSSRGDGRNQTAVSLWRQMREHQAAGDDGGYLRARTALYEMFEHLAFRFVSRLFTCGFLNPDDLRQECRVAVVQAIDQWNPERGEFPVILNYLVHRRVRAYLRNNEMIRRPHSVFDQHGRVPDSAETAPVRFASVTMTGDSEIASVDDWDAMQWFVADAADPYPQIELSRTVQQALDYLDPVACESICLRFGLDGREAHSYREMAPLLGVSYQTAKNRVERAMPLLAAALEGVQ